MKAKKILIAYYSKTGTTTKVCTLMKTKLEEATVQVDMMEFGNVKNLEAYDTVVVAAPINGMQYVEVASTFIKNHEQVLADKQIVVVYISYILKSGRKFWKNRITNGINALTKSLNPVSVVCFGGIIDSEFPRFARWIFGIPKETPLDLSNDDEVVSYVEELLS